MTSFTSFSIDSIDFNNPKPKEGFGHVCLLKGEPKEILLPELKIYSSGGIYEEDGLHYIDLLLGRTDKELYIFMNNLDRHTLECIYNHSEKWYGDEVSIDILESFYKKSIRSENNLPLLKVMINEDVQYLNADDDVVDANTIKKNMKTRVSININGLQIQEESICLNLVAKTVRTATKSKQGVKVAKVAKAVDETNETLAVDEDEAVEGVKDEVVETKETLDEANEDEVVGEDEVVEGVKDEVVETKETLDEANEDEVVETNEVVDEAVEDKKEEEVKNTIEDTDLDNKSVSSVSSRSSRRSRMSSRTAMSSQLSEQMELVKKMHREAVRAERYANKKRLAAVKAVHELRNLELAEMSSNYNTYNLNDNVSEFIETESYLNN